MADSLDKLHGGTNVDELARHSWNIFRYIGDISHLLGILILLGTIYINKSVKGISLKTQVIYFTLYICRYADIYKNTSLYLILFKIFYICSSAFVLYLSKLRGDYEQAKDTCPMFPIVAICVTLTVLFSRNTILEILWAFSEFLEGFAMVPQYIFCYRDPEGRDKLISGFIVFIGTYRVFYAFNWIYKLVMNDSYRDVLSWMSGFLEIIFFIDFLVHRFNGASLLKSTVLAVDEKVNDISHEVEMRVRNAVPVLKKPAADNIRRRRQAGEDEFEAVNENTAMV